MPYPTSNTPPAIPHQQYPTSNTLKQHFRVYTLGPDFLYRKHVAQVNKIRHNRYKNMPNKRSLEPDPGEAMHCQIRIQGHLGSEWTGWFEGLTITLDESGSTGGGSSSPPTLSLIHI